LATASGRRIVPQRRAATDDSCWIPTLAALAGTVIGGLTSFITAWATQAWQARVQRIAVERGEREELYGRFLDAIARLYARAVAEETVDYAKLVEIFALKGRISLGASEPVKAAADRSIKFLVDLYMAPSRSAADVRARMDDTAADPLTQFAERCREELDRLR
jgi:hypothetical protein